MCNLHSHCPRAHLSPTCCAGEPSSCCAYSHTAAPWLATHCCSLAIQAIESPHPSPTLIAPPHWALPRPAPADQAPTQTQPRPASPVVEELFLVGNLPHFRLADQEGGAVANN